MYVLNNYWICYNKLICHLSIYLVINAKDTVKQRRTFRRPLFRRRCEIPESNSSFPRASIKFVIALAELHCRRGKGENVGGNDGEGEVRDALSR